MSRRPSKHFWHPVNALVEEPGGWRLESLDEKTLGVIVQADDGRFQAWLRVGEQGRHVGTAETLPAAAKRLWNAAHPEAAL